MYAAMVREHYRKHRPGGFAAMTEADFERIGQQIEEQIEALVDAYEGRPVPNETTIEKIGRLRMAQLRAREQVLHEMLPPTEADEAAQAAERAAELRAAGLPVEG